MNLPTDSREKEKKMNSRDMTKSAPSLVFIKSYPKTSIHSSSLTRVDVTEMFKRIAGGGSECDRFRCNYAGLVHS